MIRLQAGAIRNIDDVKRALQDAIRLEHATIPPYLFALYSLKPGSNAYHAAALRTIALEEMLHMTLAANVLNAIGGSPRFNYMGFIVNYPAPLPMAIGSDQEGSFVVPLKRFSPETAREVFMRIESPEKPISFPEAKLSALAAGATYKTIGEFYAALKTMISLLGNAIFVGDSTRQVDRFPGIAESISVYDVTSALSAIDRIVRDGEGTADAPLDLSGEIAHFYRFEELARGKKLQADPSSEKGFSFKEVIPFDQGAVWPIKDNIKLMDYPAGSSERKLALRINYSYGRLLSTLNQVFNGYPARLPTAISIMLSLSSQATRLVAMPLGNGQLHAAPTFEFVETAI